MARADTISNKASLERACPNEFDPLGSSDSYRAQGGCFAPQLIRVTDLGGLGYVEVSALSDVVIFAGPKGISQNTTLDSLLAGLQEHVAHEQTRISGALEFSAIEAVARAEHAKLMKAVSDTSDAWKRDIPGRVVLNRFANAGKLNVGRLKTLYVRHAQAIIPDPFGEIREIFRGFRDIGRNVPR